jgi:hypothetical protein
LSGDFLAELLGCQQRPQPAQFLITQPARGRCARDQQRDTVGAYVQDVLATIDTPELTDREVAERFGRHGQGTNGRTTRYGKRGCCYEHTHSSAELPSDHLVLDQ